MKNWLIILICSVWTFQLHAQGGYTIQTVPNDHLNSASDYVSNPDGIISPEAEHNINAFIASVEDSATAEIAVVLIESIGQDDIDDFGTRLFTHWGIGKDKKDNGLLFLLVYDQREMIFRTGYGLEGVLPDVILSRIIRNEISPSLKQGDFDGGVTAGMAKVCDYLKNPEAVKEIIQREQADQAKKQVEQAAFLKKVIQIYLVVSLIVFLLFLGVLIAVSQSSRTNYKKYLNLHGIKGWIIGLAIFFPVTMILFALLYFSRIKRLRNKPVPCPKCGNKMHKLSETQEDPYLTPSQQKEESIQSVDYDVWLCGSCGDKQVLPYDKASLYSACPQCQAKTYFLSDDYVVSRATPISSGQGQRVYACKNCGKKELRSYIIPMIIVASGGGSNRGGGFGGGFSGGSWGGGSTGGGGARGGW